MPGILPIILPRNSIRPRSMWGGGATPGGGRLAPGNGALKGGPGKGGLFIPGGGRRPRAAKKCGGGGRKPGGGGRPPLYGPYGLGPPLPRK